MSRISISKAGSIPIVIGEGSPFPSSHIAGRTGRAAIWLVIAGRTFSLINVALGERQLQRGRMTIAPTVSSTVFSVAGSLSTTFRPMPRFRSLSKYECKNAADSHESATLGWNNKNQKRNSPSLFWLTRCLNQSWQPTRTSLKTPMFLQLVSPIGQVLRYCDASGLVGHSKIPNQYKCITQNVYIPVKVDVAL